MTNTLAIFIDLMNKVFKWYLDMFNILFIDDMLTYSIIKNNHVDNYPSKANMVVN